MRINNFLNKKIAKGIFSSNILKFPKNNFSNIFKEKEQAEEKIFITKEESK